MMGQPNEQNAKQAEDQPDEILISIAQDERNDTIPYNQQKLIEKH